MYKLIYSILIAAVLTGCVTRTEYGRRRLMQVNKHRTDADSRAYQVIDTSKLYQIVSAVAIADNKPLTSVNEVYLKFYANGRLGTFYNYHSEDIGSLNPKRADMGYYQFKDNKLEINTFFEHPQGGGWVNKNVIKSHRDTLQATAETILIQYKMLDLAPAFLVYKPDW